MNYNTKPSEQNILNYVNRFNRRNFYEAQNYLGAMQLTRKFKDNDNNYKNIFIKVNLINGAFKTRIGDTEGVAKRMFKRIKNFDARLKNGEISLINEIAFYKSKKKKTIRHNYSFASKYCHCHNPKQFPINDGYVRESLYRFNKTFPFATFTKKQLFEDYSSLKEAIKKFKETFADSIKIDYATTDRFLWALGREFDRRKGQKKVKEIMPPAKNRILHKAV